MSKFRDIDKGYSTLVKKVFTLGAPKIDVGIFDSAGPHKYSTMSVVEIATIHEFGNEHCPERSFLRAWFDENESKCRAAVVAMLEAVLAGKYTKDQALQLLGQRFVGEIQKRIANGIPPPNAPSTIAQKGSDKPLIDTGQLRSAITYAIDGEQKQGV